MAGSDRRGNVSFEGMDPAEDAAETWETTGNPHTDVESVLRMKVMGEADAMDPIRSICSLQYVHRQITACIQRILEDCDSTMVTIQSNDPRRLVNSLNLGRLFIRRFELAKDLNDLNAAICAIDPVLPIVSSGSDHPLALQILTHAATFRERRFRETQWTNDEDIKAAINLRKAILFDIPPFSSPNRTPVLQQLADDLFLRYRHRSHDLGDLLYAIACLEQAVTEATVWDLERLEVRVKICTYQDELLNITGDVRVLKKQIGSLNEVCIWMSPSDKRRPVAFHLLAHAHWSLFTISNDDKDISRAIESQEGAVRALVRINDDKLLLMNFIAQLARFHLERHASRAQLHLPKADLDLDRAIELLEKIGECRSGDGGGQVDDPAFERKWLRMLVTASLDRFRRQERISDLRRAIRAQEILKML